MAADTTQGSSFLNRQVEATTKAIEELAYFLRGLPGRKSLIWLSGSFPSEVLPVPGNHGVFKNYSSQIREMTDALNQSHTAVYPVDARGLKAPPEFNASMRTGEVLPPYFDTLMHTYFAKQDFESRFANQTTLQMAADDTGGHAFYNTNGLAEAARKAIDDGSTYYAITSKPTNTKTDGKLRRIKVECLKPGYTLEDRRFYFADSAPKSTPTPEAATDPMLIALRRGAPLAHSLFFEAHLQTLGDALPATPQELQHFQPSDSAATHPASLSAAKPPMVQHYAITYGLLTRQLNLGPDSQRHANLEFAAMAYDRDGNLLKGIRTKIDDTITPARYERMRQNGYQTIQRIGIPANTATLRIGVRDTTTKLIGSTEIHLPLSSE